MPAASISKHSLLCDGTVSNKALIFTTEKAMDSRGYVPCLRISLSRTSGLWPCHPESAPSRLILEAKQVGPC